MGERAKDGPEAEASDATAEPQAVVTAEVVNPALAGDLLAENERLRAELDALHAAHRCTMEGASVAALDASLRHDLRNALTSVRVHAGLILEQVTKSRCGGVTRVVGVLERRLAKRASLHDLDDAESASLPVYLRSLGQALGQERERVLDNLAGLLKGVEHLQALLVAPPRGDQERGPGALHCPAEIVEDTLRITGALLEEHGIEIVRRYEDTLPIRADRHRVIQILTNLVLNAGDSVNDACPAAPRITLKVWQTTEAGVCIEVEDNGGGISAEILEKVFQQGFTTKKDGHGLGLHNARLAARALGASLVAESDGPDSGARFTLKFPPPARAISR